MAGQSPGNWLQRQREAQGVSRKVLADLIGLSEEQVAGWEKDTVKVPVEAVPKLAEFFGKGLDEVWKTTHGNAPRPDFPPPRPVGSPEFDPMQSSIDTMFESGSQPTYASDLLDDEVEVLWLPVYDLGLGQPLTWTDGLPDGEPESVESAPAELGDANAFYIRAHDGRMSPTVEPGELVLVEPARKLSPGKLCFVRFGENADHGSGAISRFQPDPNGSVTLTCDNQDFEPISVSPEAVTLLAVTKVIKQVR